MLALAITGVVLYLPSLGLLALVGSDIYDGLRNTRILTGIQLAIVTVLLVLSIVAVVRSPRKPVAVVAVVLFGVLLALHLVVQLSLAITG